VLEEFNTTSMTAKVNRPQTFWLYSVLLFVSLAIASSAVWNWWHWASSPLVEGRSSIVKTLQVREGATIDQVGQDLEASGIIRSATAWKLWHRWLTMQKTQGNIQTGTYELSPNQTLADITTKLWQGDVALQSFTIPEGWSLTQIANALEEKGLFTAQDFLAATKRIPYDQYPWLPQNLPHLEGFLYPDTYKIPKGNVTPVQIIHQMLQQFENVALPVYQKSQKSQQLSLLDWVILSSIVEKEAVIPEERSRIAGVFLQRLQLNMTLGSDPTVEYGLNVRQTPDQPLTWKQVKTPSPYNTYLNPGLPPTPIASPGVASLEAVVEPEKTAYLYFVARYDGSHVFSRTLAEHEAAQRSIHGQRSRDRAPSG
jgi:UPF0755 protein